ncbi:MAG: DUF2938 domain-containing protein [Ignavibacteriales bacterium]|nr:DUF2938 domain-containing protein [Ignavibacteriales bacterium]
MYNVLKIVLIGIGATLTVDIWIYVLGLFNIKSLDYRFVGRWIGNFPKGKFFHQNIIATEPVKGELVIGWIAHYVIGINFAFFLFLFCGKEWIQNPQIYSAVFWGILTVVAPLFIMQPAFGFGIASSNLSKPNIRRIKSLLTHLIYGIGLYIAAFLVKQF